MKNGALLVLVVSLTVFVFCLGGYVGSSTAHHTTTPIACTPNADGLVINGKEVPLTSAQRDSLARGR